MSKFKVGDKVRCIDNVGQEPYLEIGVVYEVTIISKHILSAIYVNGILGALNYNRFELVRASTDNQPDTPPNEPILNKDIPPKEIDYEELGEEMARPLSEKDRYQILINIGGD